MDFYGSTGLLAGLSFNLAKMYFSLYAPFFQGENSTLRTKIYPLVIFSSKFCVKFREHVVEYVL